MLIHRYLKKTEFSSYNDFMENFEVIIPERFNFAYDVVDEWARLAPNKPALLWTDENGAGAFCCLIIFQQVYFLYLHHL